WPETNVGASAARDAPRGRRSISQAQHLYRQALTSIFCFAAFATHQLPLSPPKAEGLCRFSGITLTPPYPESPCFRALHALA
ncbi:hypothetical protein LD001_20870, partial [Pseudomonas kurunegalensis]|uniref:hypothetical protein n=1 Tax=Pseudomonas kurunegalensis TaxID=485880 RepID=UPI001CDD835A